MTAAANKRRSTRASPSAAELSQFKQRWLAKWADDTTTPAQAERELVKLKQRWNEGLAALMTAKKLCREFGLEIPPWVRRGTKSGSTPIPGKRGRPRQGNRFRWHLVNALRSEFGFTRTTAFAHAAAILGETPRTIKRSFEAAEREAKEQLEIEGPLAAL